MRWTCPRCDRQFGRANQPLARSLDVWLILPRLPDDPRIARSEPMARGRFAALVKLGGPEEVDDQLRGWLSEARAAADV